MKNIHILPTDQPSRLFKFANELHLDTIPKDYYKKYNIYITSDEEIREGDWFLSDFNSFPLHNIKELSERKDSLGWKQEDLKNNLKIILTTDPTLITDGVQEIDNEFLEWFVKNSSCEFVEIIEAPKLVKMIDNEFYKIRIPQKEPKQDCTCGVCNECEEQETVQILNEAKENALKQSTLEEAAEKYANKKGDIPTTELEDAIFKQGFLDGARWQAERMYSEKDLRNAYFSAIKTTGEGWNGEYAGGNSPNIEEKFNEEFEEWFEQFKKK